MSRASARARLLKLGVWLIAAVSLAGCVVYPVRPAYYGRPAVVYARPTPYGYYGRPTVVYGRPAPYRYYR